ncbi:hypothetical protein O1611_g5155 [Lasiodiplodia mahajangana]|uniref:Uncharacterized protein n=1 Tax=Lasiodiplodia mahajangana TaxID=1108764 RepID=A0ACC2JLW2_9PEZI|nr:hypothetical protein O1611_g5155 [Lasiodiplodia mahajangana]
MGIDVPTELRRDMALAGEWTVTHTRVIDDTPKADKDDGDSKPASVDSTATGVRKRPKQEDDDEKDEEEEHVQGLFKKPRRWGRDSKHAVEDNAALDALLSTPLTKPPKKEKGKEVKKVDIKEDLLPSIKKEELETDGVSSTIAEPTTKDQSIKTSIKEEDDNKPTEPIVVFKKRKPKNIRQK